MKKQKLKVLSIDFDFFQKAPAALLYEYPDGHDLSTELSIFVWSSYYVRPFMKDKINSVKINQKKFKEMLKILKRNALLTPMPKIMVANSHKHIYNFVLDGYDPTKYNGLDLVNVDMHHDMFNDNEEVDCGNWVTHLTKAIPNYQLTWIANPASRKVYGLGKKFDNLIEHDFSSIADKDFDMIFLCRSDCWTPPHLDKYFNEMYNTILENYYDIQVDRQIRTPRNMEQAITEMEKAFSNISSLPNYREEF